MATTAKISDFPCALTLDVPFPTARLASIALKSLSVDKELSPLVQRTFTISPADGDGDRLLQVEYRATTNRMLRVAVNSFMESLYLVLEVMEHLDTDVVAANAAAIGNGH